MNLKRIKNLSIFLNKFLKLFKHNSGLKRYIKCEFYLRKNLMLGPISLINNCGMFLMTKENRRVSKEKKEFVLSLTGYAKGEPKIAKREGQILFFEVKGSLMVYFDMYIQIGKGKTKILIPKEYLEYPGAISHATVNIATGEMEIEIQETIEIFTSKSHNEGCKWGTLELHIKARENISQEPVFPATIGKVSGCGTGALKGATVEGIDQLWRKVDCAEATKWGYAVNYARVGVITGWPLEVTSWPPK